MKKIKRLCSLLILLSVLYGCMKVDINYSIDEKYKVKLVYHVQMDYTVFSGEEGLRVRNMMRELVRDYEGKGFVFAGKNDETIDFTLTLEKQADSYEEAFKYLKEMITNPEISFFLKAEVSSHSEKYEQVIDFYFETNLSQIVTASNIDDLPPSIKNTLFERMKSSEVNFYLTLPTSNVVNVNEAVEVTTANRKTIFKLPISWDESSVMDLTIRMSLDDGKMTPYSIDDSIENTKRQASLYNVLFYVGIAGGIISMGGFAYLSMKKKS
jgi:hypothetical protein